MLPTTLAATQAGTPTLHHDFRGAIRSTPLRVGALQPDSAGETLPLPAAPTVALAWSKTPAPGEALGSIGGTDGDFRLVPTITQGWPLITPGDLRARYFVDGVEVAPGHVAVAGQIMTADVRAPSVYAAPQAMAIAAPPTAATATSAQAAFESVWLENDGAGCLRWANAAQQTLPGAATLAARLRFRPHATDIHEVVSALGETVLRLQLRPGRVLRAVWRIAGVNRFTDILLPGVGTEPVDASIMMRADPTGAMGTTADIWVDDRRTLAPGAPAGYTPPTNVYCDLFTQGGGRIPTIGVRGWLWIGQGTPSYADFFDPETHEARSLGVLGVVGDTHHPTLYFNGLAAFATGVGIGAGGSALASGGWREVAD